ncbi:MAG TPA: HlyD family efflux transporter periplasmic adaptor subunit [Burkholderiales bacterium]|nr:HlyD family efflux transporter periplasmic adaptor subunit [Burkholderiales bacterium]
MSQPLFRTEALEARHDALQGGVLVASPPTLRLLVLSALAVALALVAYAFWGQYTRKEHVSGYLAPTLGLIKIYTPQAGTVLEKRVSEGQHVKQGEALLVVSSERATAATAAAEATMLRELAARRDSLRREQSKQAEIDKLAAATVADRIRGLEAELAQARVQRDIQRSRVASAERTLARNAKLVAAHFVSEAAAQQKQEELLEQRGQLAGMERTITALTRDLHAAQLDLAASEPRRANNAATLERQISEIDQQLTEGDARREVVLTAPADGTVTTVLAEAGQAVKPDAPLLSILPAGAALEARLLVPTRAAGFIRPEQEVAVRYQAFPYQRFGAHIGRVTKVGRTVIQPNETSLPLPLQEPVYLVTVRLPAQAVHAYGQDIALQAGMVLDADVRIDRRRLIEWVFDPVLSITGRM